MEEFQDEAGGSRSELTYLLLMEDKLSDICEFARPDFRRTSPSLSLPRPLRRPPRGQDRQDAYARGYAGKRDKKAELSTFDSIVSGNFKKKPEEKTFLKVEEPRVARRSKERERQSSKSPRRASGSNDNKLNRLFSKEENPLKEKEKELKESVRRGEEEQLNATTSPRNDESVSFSAVLSNNVTVKTRRRKQSGEAKKEKARKAEEKGGEGEGDEAFMFFRPKKGKK